MSRDWRRRLEINADELEIRTDRVIVKEDDNRRRDDVGGAEDRRRKHRRDDDVLGIEDNCRRHCGCGRDSVGGEEDRRRHRWDDVAGASELWYNRDLAGSGRGCRRRRDDDDRRRRGFCGCRWI